MLTELFFFQVEMRRSIVQPLKECPPLLPHCMCIDEGCQMTASFICCQKDIRKEKRLNHYYTHRPRYSTSRERGKEVQCHNQPYKSVAELRIISLWRSQSFGPVDENPASSCHRFVCRIKQYSL